MRQTNTCIHRNSTNRSINLEYQIQTPFQTQSYQQQADQSSAPVIPHVLQMKHKQQKKFWRKTHTTQQNQKEIIKTGARPDVGGGISMVTAPDGHCRDGDAGRGETCCAPSRSSSHPWLGAQPPQKSVAAVSSRASRSRPTRSRALPRSRPPPCSSSTTAGGSPPRASGATAPPCGTHSADPMRGFCSRNEQPHRTEITASHAPLLDDICLE